MATSTPQRQMSTARRKTSAYRTQNRYANLRQSKPVSGGPSRLSAGYSRSAVRPVPGIQPMPDLRQHQEARKEKGTRTAVRSRGQAVFIRNCLKLAGVFILCCLMIYRYAVILETNDQIAKLKEECAEIEANNQAIQAKIDRGLELGALEEYATTQLGMIRPDSSQIFYIDMQMDDVSANEKNEGDSEEKPVLQGTPGALVHAIQVLN